MVGYEWSSGCSLRPKMENFKQWRAPGGATWPPALSCHIHPLQDWSWSKGWNPVASHHLESSLPHHTCCSLWRNWVGLVQGAFQVAVLSFWALSSALLHATYLNSRHLVSLAPTTFPALSCALGDYQGFPTNTSYVHCIWEANIPINTPETLHMYTLDNL